MAAVKSYSGAQIFLHWLIVVLVFFQYIAHNLMTALWEGRMLGTVTEKPIIVAHVVIGIAVFGLALWRLILRFREDAPEKLQKSPTALRRVNQITHMLFYALLLAIPATGVLAWFFGVVPAIDFHQVLTNLLLAVIAIHVVSAIIQQFFIKNNVIMRMIGQV